MTKHVLFIQGGGHGAYEEDELLAGNLQKLLGAEYEVRYPRMPDEDAPDYEAWKTRITAELAAMHGEVIFVGHSLGASFLLKFLSEQQLEKPAAGAFMIAPPYWGTEDWEAEEYALPDDFGRKLEYGSGFVFYHSRDDKWVPFSHLSLYADALPRAVTRAFDGRGHQFNGDLSEVAEDIKRLSKK